MALQTVIHGLLVSKLYKCYRFLLLVEMVDGYLDA